MQFGVFDLTLGQIMAYFQDAWVVGWVLIGSGVLAAIWLFENLTDPIPILGSLVDVFVAIGAYLGFIVGILDMLVGYVVWTTNPTGTIVAVALIVVGFSLSMRLLSKVPLALVFALAASGFVTFTIYGFLMPYATASIPYVSDIAAMLVSLKGMIVIFLIVFTVAYVVGGVALKAIQLIGRLLSSTPVSVVIGLAAIAIGVVVIVMPAMVGLVVPWPTT
ncbi:MAG: hypothetical protein QXS20_06435 [Candidatus Thorarchaeota archaeon]